MGYTNSAFVKECRLKFEKVQGKKNQETKFELVTKSGKKMTWDKKNKRVGV